MNVDIVKVKQDIKNWEHSFTDAHRRLPSKADINDNADIKNLYALYKSLKSGKPPRAVSKSRPEQDKLESKNSNREDVPATPKGELGPTPQANGRILSIFDMKWTPPESSPLKHKIPDATLEHSPSLLVDSMPELKGTTEENGNHTFATPTKKPKSINATPSNTAKRKLNFSDIETPRYMKTSLSTPSFAKTTSNVVEFQVSPSPLRPQKMFKKLTDVYKASIEDPVCFEESDAAGNVPAEKNPEDSVEVEGGALAAEEASSDSKVHLKKSKTQKRQTRRSKMAPRPTDEAQSLEHVNIREEIACLDERQKKSLLGYINSDSEDEEHDVDPSHANQSPVKRTRKPMAENYKRLKINDPRSRRFKQRMRR
ncbi:uncharacterized protein LODBEIA_P08270 [Lodderomyces beijingensis]|uniref:DNA replication regulator SLD2 n=1 Tax=Lodderomyces beijingensis TaxID=1775926 RepID=A0ABP0ZG99_9ASCO